MARIARTGLVALVLAAFSFPATASAADASASLRGCSPKSASAKKRAKAPIAYIAPNRKNRCARAKTRKGVPLAHIAI